MRIIVDASVVVAALMADGTVRDVLLSSADLDYVAPEYVRIEVGRQVSRISLRSKLPPETLRAVLDDVFECIELIPAVAYADRLEEAEALAAKADAAGDEDYIALALRLRAPIWTLDKDLKRIPLIGVLSTKDVTDL